MTATSAAALLFVCICISPLLSGSGRTLVAALALGGLAAALVAGDKFRAAGQEVVGDEIQAAGLNFLWTNSPKIGLLVGVLLFKSALPVAVVAAALAALLARPDIGRFKDAWDALRQAGLWATPFVAIVSSFVLAWSDTYFLVAHLGVARAGSYEALYRVLGVSSYFFLPWTSVITSRVSANERRPLMRPLLLSLGATALALSCAVLFLDAWGETFFPDLALPLEAIPALIIYYILVPVSFALGAALYVKSAARTVAWSVATSAVVALLGHTFVTLRGGPLQAATVAAGSMGLAVILQGTAYLRLYHGLGRSAFHGDRPPDLESREISS